MKCPECCSTNWKLTDGNVHWLQRGPRGNGLWNVYECLEPNCGTCFAVEQSSAMLETKLSDPRTVAKPSPKDRRPG